MAVGADSLFEAHPADDGTVALAGELFRQHSRMVLAVCRRLLPDTAEAEDAMQQTFVSAYRSLLAGSEPQRADVWLAAIARNECLDRIRARMREPLAEHGRNGRSEAPDTLAAVIAGEEFRALSRSIEELPTQQREALVLHEFCGLPYGEVAAAIGVSESAIGSLLFRARRSLRSAFRRGYAVLPLPEIWNASAQLLSRGPAIKVAALPMVAKVGCGAVAVGLTAGAVVAVDNEVEAQSRPRSVPHVAAAPETPFGGESACDRQHAGGREVGGPGVGDGRRCVAPVISERPARSSPPRREHRPRSIPTTTAGRPMSAQEPAQLVSPAAAPPSRHTGTPVSGKSSSHVSSAERTHQRATRSRQVVRKDVDEAVRQAKGHTADTGSWEPPPSSRQDGTGDPATAPGLARGHDEHGPPGEAETVDASAPSADATPAASRPDHPDHPGIPSTPTTRARAELVPRLRREGRAASRRVLGSAPVATASRPWSRARPSLPSLAAPREAAPRPGRRASRT